MRAEVQTLDESMPIFRQLEIYDPTANNDRIIVTFTLNEDGTAYCRVTRSDSGAFSDDGCNFRRSRGNSSNPKESKHYTIFCYLLPPFSKTLLEIGECECSPKFTPIYFQYRVQYVRDL